MITCTMSHRRACRDGELSCSATASYCAVPRVGEEVAFGDLIFDVRQVTHLDGGGIHLTTSDSVDDGWEYFDHCEFAGGRPLLIADETSLFDDWTVTRKTFWSQRFQCYTIASQGACDFSRYQP